MSSVTLINVRVSLTLSLAFRFIVALVGKQRMQLIAWSCRRSLPLSSLPASLLTFRGFKTKLCLSFKLLKERNGFFQFNLKMKDTIQVKLTRVLVSISRETHKSFSLDFSSSIPLGNFAIFESDVKNELREWVKETGDIVNRLAGWWRAISKWTQGAWGIGDWNFAL